MVTQKTRISQVAYNPAARWFEASVTLFEGDEAFTYPVSLPAPLDLGYADVSKAVLDRAVKRHNADRKGMRSRRPAGDLSMPIIVPPSVREATVGLWDRLLGNRAA